MRILGKKAAIQNQSPVPVNFRFLPGADLIKTYGPLSFKPRVALVLDSPSPNRAGEVAKHLETIPVLVNIDHHVSNADYGHFRWVDPASSSVGEMLFHLLPALGVELTRPIALCLYVAVLTDLGKFQFMVTPDSGVRVLKLVIKLIGTGLVPYEIYKKVYNYYSIAPLKLLGEALRTLRFAAGGRIAYLDITGKMQERWGGDYDSTDNLISFPRDLRATRVAIVFTELPGRIKVSFRSKEPALIDVNRIASVFGGGGHPAAAGAEVPGSLKTVRSKVLSMVRKELKRLGGPKNSD